MGCVRRDVAVADDEVVLLERGKETWARMEAVARIKERGELRVNLVCCTELAVQVVGDGTAERVAVVERKAEGRDAVAPRGGRRAEQARLGALA